MKISILGKSETGVLSVFVTGSVADMVPSIDAKVMDALHGKGYVFDLLEVLYSDELQSAVFEGQPGTKVECDSYQFDPEPICDNGFIHIWKCILAGNTILNEIEVD